MRDTLSKATVILKLFDSHDMYHKLQLVLLDCEGAFRIINHSTPSSKLHFMGLLPDAVRYVVPNFGDGSLKIELDGSAETSFYTNLIYNKKFVIAAETLRSNLKIKLETRQVSIAKKNYSFPKIYLYIYS